MNPISIPSPRDIVLIGGSAGAIDGLRKILKLLPSGLPASLFIVVHTHAEGPGLLPAVLARAGEMPAIHPRDGESIRRGQIYVAPPDHHLTLAAGEVIRVRKGPRENNSRPAIDTLFRSATVEGYAPRSIAILLSGYLDDGSAGMNAIRRKGGLGIIQDPEDAVAGDLPARALHHAGADYVLTAAGMGAKITELVDGTAMSIKQKGRGRRQKYAGDEAQRNSTVAYTEEGEGMPSVFACPDCHGVLWEIRQGGSVRYRCRTGHAYTEATLNEELSHASEQALWAAMRALEEKAAMARRMTDSAIGPRVWRQRLEEEACTYATHAEMIRKMILGEPVVPETSDPVSGDERALG